MAQHKLPKSQRDAIVAIVKEHADRLPTRFMVSYWLAERTGIKRKTALEYVNMALRDGHVIKHGFTIVMPGPRKT